MYGLRKRLGFFVCLFIFFAFKPKDGSVVGGEYIFKRENFKVTKLQHDPMERGGNEGRVCETTSLHL